MRAEARFQELRVDQEAKEMETVRSLSVKERRETGGNQRRMRGQRKMWLCLPVLFFTMEEDLHMLKC